MASIYKKEDNQIALHHHHRHCSMPHHATEGLQQTPQDSKGMTNKHVHWSQYADEISFFTIRDLVRLSDSVDDDYFSDEDVEADEPLKGKRKHEKEIFIHPDFWKAVDNANLQSPPLPSSHSPPPMDPNGKTRFVPAYETDSTLSDDSNFFDEPKYVEIKQPPILRRSQSPAPKAIKHEKQEDTKGKKEEEKKTKKKKGKEEEETIGSDKVADSNAKTLPKKEEKALVASKSSEGTSERPNGTKKMHNSYWISPQIYLSKRDATSARGDYARGVKSPVESRKTAKHNGRSSSTERRHMRSFSHHLHDSGARPASETRGSNRHCLEDTPHRSHSKNHYECITENMKPNLPKVPPKRKRSTSKTRVRSFAKSTRQRRLKNHLNHITVVNASKGKCGAIAFIISLVSIIDAVMTAVTPAVIQFIFQLSLHPLW
ncbi:unnamed protein product [Hydatigera taeniaeformis]|uniref:TPX2 domain-containing protein n=1 Tax=Hydatigena taeniaeformis TaxID=6205 RepID=A0A0R3WZ92_HYDTA|nr:unnamed protein product [Hydatigera taeniaeformis]